MTIVFSCTEEGQELYENTEVEDPELLWEEASEYLKEVACAKLELQADTVINPEWPEIRVGDYIRVVTPERPGHQ